MAGDGAGGPAAAPRGRGAGAPGGGGAVWLHAVVRAPLSGRARRWIGSRRGEDRTAGGSGGATEGLQGTRRVQRGRLSAVVSPVVGGGDGGRDAAARLDRHARVVEALAGSGTVVPAPPGVRAPDEAAVRAFLDRARLALEEALDLFDGACEMRLHVRSSAAGAGPDGGSGPAAVEAAAGLYRRLRRLARASRRLPTAAGDILTAAFLVPRAGWGEGADLAARWREGRPGLEAELTGPWAPYDFVRMFPVREGGSPGDGTRAGTAAGGEAT